MASSPSLPHIVLVHGALHGAWCWDEVSEHLAAEGFAVLAPDLPGHGSRREELRHASLDGYLQTVNAVIDSTAGDVVLVGHSMAGHIVARAARGRSDRVRRLVLLNAQVLQDGQAHADTLSEERRSEYLGLAKRQGGESYLISDEEFWRRWLQDLPRHDPRVVRALSLRTPQPLRPVLEPVCEQDFGAAGVPALYLRSTEDTSSTSGRVDEFIRRLPPGTPVRRVPGSHDCMISEPRAVAGAIAKAAREAVSAWTI